MNKISVIVSTVGSKVYMKKTIAIMKESLLASGNIIYFSVYKYKSDNTTPTIMTVDIGTLKSTNLHSLGLISGELQ